MKSNRKWSGRVSDLVIHNVAECRDIMQKSGVDAKRDGETDEVRKGGDR
jgi:hypothetical protein